MAANKKLPWEKSKMTTTRIFILLNILLCTILLVDAFVLPYKIKIVSITQTTSKLTRAKRTSYYNYFIHTSDNCNYEVTRLLYDNLKENDSVKISSSLIINMPVEISYQIDNDMYRSDIGQLKTKKSEPIGLIISLLLSFIVLTQQYTGNSKYLNVFRVLQIISFSISSVVFLFVLIELFLI